MSSQPRWEYGSALLSEYDADGFLGVQIDAYGELESGSEPLEAIHPGGFFHRPRDPDENGSASVLIFNQGDQSFSLVMQDSRSINNQLLPKPPKGSSVQYADTLLRPSFDVHDGEDGTKNVYVEYDDGGTIKAHSITVGYDGNGDPLVEVVHGDGMGLVMFKGSVMMRNNAGDGYFEVDPSGPNVNGNLKVNGSIVGAADIKSGTSVSLEQHLHLSAMGPVGPPIPTP